MLDLTFFPLIVRRKMLVYTKRLNIVHSPSFMYSKMFISALKRQNYRVEHFGYEAWKKAASANKLVAITVITYL